MRKSLLVMSFAIIAGACFAQEAPNEQPQPAKRPLPSCNIPSLLSGWRLSGDVSSYRVRDMKLPIGKELKPGDALFYVAFDDAKKLYTSPGLIELKDRSPLSRDAQIRPGEPLEVVATLEKMDGGASFEVVRAGTGGLFSGSSFIPVRPDGMLCSDVVGKMLGGGWGMVGMPMFFQDAPLVASTVDLQGARRRSASVVVLSMDAATINLAVTVSIDGRVVKKAQRAFDLISGQISLGTLQFAVRRGGDGVVVESALEPTDYRKWIESI